MMEAPITYSWPSSRPKQQATDNDPDDPPDDSLLSHAALQAWVAGLSCENGQLVIPADSLLLLPAQLPYEMLGPCILAAVDTAVAAAQQQDQQQLGLQLCGIDLQEPVCGPLLTCFQAYPTLQQLSLRELNIDSHAAATLANLWQPQHAGHSSSSSVSGLKVLSMQAVFMCQMAWQRVAQGIMAGVCQLQTLRLQECLTPSSLALLAAAIPAGCACMQELDLSCNTLTAACPSTNSTQARGCADSSSGIADQAWASFVGALAAPCCPALRALVLSRCSLGPAAAAALTKLLRAKSRSSLQQLHLAQCAGMGEAALQQLAAAAGSHPSLRVLDLSSTALTDSCLKALTGQGSSWPWQHHAPCQQLQELNLSGNNGLSGAAVAQLARLLAAGACGMHALRRLDVSNCPGIGDTGAAGLAGCLTSCHCPLETLCLSGCEVTDEGAAALAAAVAGSPASADAAAAAGAASAGRRSAQHISSLQKLRLADNQITAAGVQAFAAAVRNSSCKLQLLDVSFNMVGPKAVKPLVEAAAAAAAARGDGANDSDDNGSSDGSVQHLIVLHECSHDLWRVESAKAAARAAAAADAAATAAAEAAAAAAAAGSTWDPHGSDQLSVQQHPAAATAHGFANSSYHGAGTATCCSSMRTHAGSSVALSPLPDRRGVCSSSAVWLFNGLFSDPAEAPWSPESPAKDEFAAAASPAAASPAAASPAAPEAHRPPLLAAAAPATAATQIAHLRRSSSSSNCGGPDDSGSCSRSACDGSDLESGGSLETVDPALLAGSSSASLGDLGVALGFAPAGGGVLSEGGSWAGSCQEEARGQVPAADCSEAEIAAAAAAGTEAHRGSGSAAVSTVSIAAPAADDGNSSPAQQESGTTAAASSPASSITSGCMQAEASFAYQFTAEEDVVHSPTRYDQKLHEQQQQQQHQQQHQQQQQQQQQQRQQLKGLLGSQEFTLSPPNPLFFSNSPLASPIASRRVPGGVADLQLRLPALAGVRGGATGSSSQGPAAGGGILASVAAPCSSRAVERQAAAAPAAAEPSSVDTGVLQGAQVAPAAGQGHSSDHGADEVDRQPVTFKPLCRSGAGGQGVQLQTAHQQQQQQQQLQLQRQPFSPDRQLAAPSIRALPPFSPRRRLGLSTPSPPSASIVAAAAAAEVTALLQAAPFAGGAAADTVADTVYQRQAKDSRAGVAGTAAGAGEGGRKGLQAGMSSPAAGAVHDTRASCGSIGSVGSSRSPAGSAGRQRVGGASKSGSPLQQVAAIAAGAPDSRGSPAVSKQPELRQQQCQHAARQLFGELQGTQQIKAVASSGSYWCNLSGCDLDVVGDGARGRAAGKQHCALPLVG